MRRLMLLMGCCLLLFGTAMAQTKVVSGKVTDANGTPVVNASVIVKGTQIGTTSKTDGTYSLSVPENAKTLVISAVGMIETSVSVTGNGTVNISLQPLNKNLDEVVVTAYGNTQKKAFTGTASTIKAEKFKDLQVSTLTGVLQGNASGVLAVSSNGQPGENPTIRIRGIGSVNASSDPLIVVDGAPYGGNISSINPSDIESITVLKDASSTALYGNRAANGVLLVTTKGGKGEARLSISALTGWSSRAVKDYEYLSSQQLYETTWEALRNQALITPNLITSTGSASAEEYASKTVAGTLAYNPYRVAQPIGTDGKLKSGLTQLWNEDWSDALLRTGNRKDINFNISGGSDKTKYYFSGGYLDDQGLAIESRFKRYTGRLKVDTKVNNWLNAGVNTNVSYSTQNYPTQGGSAYNNVIGWIRGISSIYPVYLRDTATGNYILDAAGNKQYDYGNNGQVTRPYGKGSNPAGTTTMNPTSYTRFISSANAYAEAMLMRGLKFKTQYVLDYYQYQQDTYYNPFVGDGAAYGGRSYKSREASSTQTFTNTLTYDKHFGGIHNINAMIGMESYRYHDGVVGAEARGFTFPNVTELSYGSTPYTTSSASYDLRMVSYFGRLNYDLMDKYHLSATLRRDGTSRFADSVRWGTFYSVGASWNIDREDFMKNVELINELKLRASYGTTGNQALGGYFPYYGSYSAGANIAGYSGSIIGNLGNGNLTWETQKTLDLGIDFAILKSRLSGSFTYFQRKSDKLLFSRPLPPSVGIGGINDNIGSVENKGIEIDLTSVNIKSRNFEWTTSVNLSHVKNKITSLPQTSIAGSNYSNLIVGESLYNFYIREYAGVDMTNGTPTWYIDKTGTDGKVYKDTTHTYSLGTRYYKGTSLPTWTGGMTNTVRYKDFDLSILISFSLGGKIYDGDYAGLMYASVGTTPGQNWTKDILNRWQSTTNPGDGKTPKLTSTTDYQGTSASTRFLFDASYARVRNVTLGYHIPKSILGNIKSSNARVFVDWQNPLTIFGRKGLDPESGLSGVTSSTSSAYKTLSFGVNIDF